MWRPRWHNLAVMWHLSAQCRSILLPMPALCMLRGKGVNVDGILRQGERMGIYYYEAGANQRPSRVIYDRQHSSIMDASCERPTTGPSCSKGDFSLPA